MSWHCKNRINFVLGQYPLYTDCVMYFPKLSSIFSVIFKEYGYISEDSHILLQMPTNKIIPQLMKLLVTEMEIQ